ncbi:MAG: DRTGG domain-containing protein [Chloroflexi bacterium]|nr:DRTGG domain-containing protein [Chloroflexota bacterium]
MSVLHIVGNLANFQPGAGKTSVAAALLVIANASGKKAAYYKPFSSDPDADPDVAFMSGLLQSTSSVSAVPTPRPLSFISDAASTDEAKAEVSRLESAADIVIIEAPAVTGHLGGPYSQNQKTLLVHRSPPSPHAGTIATDIDATKGFSGFVINAIPIHRRDEVARDLAGQSVPVAVIPESRGMLSVTVEQLAEHVNGQWVLDPVNIDAPVERFMIGGNIMDSGPTYFGRYANQAVITRVERPDIQMACMGENTKCLVLTGPGEPTEYIKAEALKRGIPLIQVRSNTIDTADSLAGLLDKADARTTKKARHFAGLLERYMGAEALERLLS